MEMGVWSKNRDEHLRIQREYMNTYRKTQNGLVNRIYCKQKVSSQKRGHPPPDYTKEQLRNWILKHKLFPALWAEYVASKYETKLAPSVDRIDDYKPYSFNNIHLTTWKENNRKSLTCKKRSEAISKGLKKYHAHKWKKSQ